MDPKKLPKRALIDTGVFIRAVDRSVRDPYAENCRAFWEAMLDENQRILVAAPTMAEFLRKPEMISELPRVGQVEYVDFNMRAAILLGTRLPRSELKEVKTAAGQTLTHLEYNAMIVSCALAHQADCVVYLDPDFEPLCAAADIEAHTPDWFRSNQLMLL